MTDEIRWEIETWFNWWRARADTVAELSAAAKDPDANVLLYGGLEALSQWWATLVGEPEKPAKRRFGSFLVETAGKPDIFDRISLPSVWRRADADKQKLTPSDHALLASYDRKPHSQGDPIRTLDDDPMKLRVHESAGPSMPLPDLLRTVSATWPDTSVEQVAKRRRSAPIR